MLSQILNYIYLQENGGQCGVCGDSWEAPHPQPHETGGLYGNGVIAKTYLTGIYPCICL